MAAPGENCRAFFQAIARPERPTHTQGFGMAGDLVGKDFHVAQNVLQTRHHLVHAIHRLGEAVKQGGIAQEPLNRPVCLAKAV